MMDFDTLKEAEEYIFDTYEWDSSKELLYFFDEFIFESNGKYYVPIYSRS